MLRQFQQSELGFLSTDQTDSGGGDNYSFWDYYDAFGPDIFWNDGPWWNTQDAGGSFTIPIETEIGCKTGLEPGCVNQSNWWDFLTPILAPFSGSSPLPTYNDVPPQPAGALPDLPGYCPKGTYHPMSDPFACVPFPTMTPGQNQRPQQPNQQGSPAKPGSSAATPKCPGGQVFNPQTGKCVQVPCPQGLVFNPKTNKCEKPAVQPKPQNLTELAKQTPWWIWLLLGGTVLLASSKDDAPPRRRR